MYPLERNTHAWNLREKHRQKSKYLFNTKFYISLLSRRCSWGWIWSLSTSSERENFARALHQKVERNEHKYKNSWCGCKIYGLKVLLMSFTKRRCWLYDKSSICVICIFSGIFRQIWKQLFCGRCLSQACWISNAFPTFFFLRISFWILGFRENFLKRLLV